MKTWIDRKIFSNFYIPVLWNSPLSKWTTFKLGGKCPCLINCQTPEELILTIRFLHKHKLPFFLMGGGSNLIISDEGIGRAVVRYVTTTPIIKRTGNKVKVSASTSLDDLAVFAATQGLEGINCASGIPGTVGGAIVGNAGAFGQQIGDRVVSVKLLDPSGKIKMVEPKDLGFAYRHSNLKESNDVVIEAVLGLQRGDSTQLLQERREFLELRHSKHPDLRQEPCAGSIFRNIEPTSKAQRRQAAGWFLEQVGGKKLRCGGAAIYRKHANIIVKKQKCTAQNVFDLTWKMQVLVKKNFGFDLVREVRFIGNFAIEREELKDVPLSF